MKILVVIISFSFIITSCNKHQEHGEPKVDTSNKKASKYICPMHPQISSEKPGQNCSICGMDLVPVDEESDEYEDEDHSEHDSMKMDGGKESSSDKPNQSNHMQPNDRATIKLKLDKQQIIGVKTDSVRRKTLFENIKAPGRIAFDPELYTAQSEYLEALRQQRKVRNSPLQDVRRSTDEMVRSSRTRLQVLGLGNTEIKALARKGSVSDGLIVSGNNDNLIYADVFESDLAKIKPGQIVKIKASFIPGEPLRGEVLSVDQLIDPKTRSGKVRIKVFVKKGRGKFEPRIITKIFETDDDVAVLKGLGVGDEVVTSANFMIDSESRLKAVIRNTGKESGHNH